MKKNYTHLVLVLDASGSMAHLQQATIEGVNALLREQRQIPRDLTTALYQFNDQVAERLRAVQDLSTLNYLPNGGTALLDALGKAIDDEGAYLRSLKEAERPDKVVFLVVTDGEENSSRSYTLPTVREKVMTQQVDYQWQFVFMGANIDAFKTASSFNIPNMGTYQWTHTAQGTGRSYAVASEALSAYRSGVVNCMNMAEAEKVVPPGPVNSTSGAMAGVADK